MVGQRYLERVKFTLERLFIRGIRFQLICVAALILGISLTGGGLAYYGLGPSHGTFESFADAVWWAFLRLTDPGYLGDDRGTLLRVVSTCLTVLGYVVFLGTLVAIMTQWLLRNMRELEAGVTPVAKNDHVVILGYTNRTARILRELLLSTERVRRFLDRHGARRLNVVILAETASTALSHELRARVGDCWDADRVILRSGSHIRLNHLERADFLHAAAVIVPGADFLPAGAEMVDAHTIKALLSMQSHAEFAHTPEPPLAVAEIFDVDKVGVAERAYGGPVEIIASAKVVARLVAQNIRQPGLSHLYRDLLSYQDGNEIYSRDLPDLVGARFQELIPRFPRAVLLGVVRMDERGAPIEPILNPPDGFVIGRRDRLVLLAERYTDTKPNGAPTLAIARGSRSCPPAAKMETPRRVLILGWTHKVAALIAELDRYSEPLEITVLSTRSIKRRIKVLNRHEPELKRIRLEHVSGDYSVHTDLEQVHPERFQTIVLMGSEWLSSSAEADARTIVGFLLLKEILRETGATPYIVGELMDEDTLPLIGALSRTEFIVTPLILSHILAQVAMRRELRMVFDSLFSAGGAEIVFAPTSFYGIAPGESFFAVRRVVAEHGDTALGLRVNGKLYLNPLADTPCADCEGLEIVVLRTVE